MSSIVLRDFDYQAIDLASGPPRLGRELPADLLGPRSLRQACLDLSPEPLLSPRLSLLRRATDDQDTRAGRRWDRRLCGRLLEPAPRDHLCPPPRHRYYC